ncbi:MAG: NUDIX domain-containing protein [Trueperaceae bacterium]
MKQVVSAFLYNAQGQVLLQQRDDKPNIAFPGYWGLFGGGVEKGETLEEAFDREVWEELEYHVTQKDLWLIAKEARAHFYIFLVPIDVTLEKLKLNEGQGFGFFETKNALATLKLPPVTRFVLEAHHHLMPLRKTPASNKQISGAVLYNAQGHVLLQHRENRAGILSPGTWDIFGGHAEGNETPEETLVRELWEELEYRPTRQDLWLVTPAAYGTFYDFLVPLDVPLEHLKLKEGQGFGFFSVPEALETLESSEGTRAILQTFEHYQHYQKLI